MAIFSDHPYTSITIKIEQLASPRNDEVDPTIELYISDLIHLIKLQKSSGASEAARAIRKRLKYGGSVDEQGRALQILELLVLNAGVKIGPVIASDGKLVDVLKGVATGSGRNGDGAPYPREVQARVQALAIGWKTELKDLDGYESLASLWKCLPHKRSRSRSVRTAADEDEEEPSNVFDAADAVRSPSPSSPRVQRQTGRIRKSKKPQASGAGRADRATRRASGRTAGRRKGIVYADEEYGIPQINYKKEAGNIRSVIADCHTHTTALNNLLITLPAGQSPLDTAPVTAEFDKCKSIRRKVLKYLQFVGVGDEAHKTPEIAAMDAEFLGSLISANEQLVAVFKKFDQLAGYTDDNPAPNYSDESSDESYYTESDEEDTIAARLDTLAVGSSSKSPPPPRPAKPAALAAPHATLQRMNTSSTVASDPFGDTNEVGHHKSLYE